MATQRGKEMLTEVALVGSLWDKKGVIKEPSVLKGFSGGVFQQKNLWENHGSSLWDYFLKINKREPYWLQLYQYHKIMPILLCCPLPFGSWNSLLLLGKEVEWDIWTKVTQCLPSVQASRTLNGFSWRIGCFWNQIIFQNFIIFTILDSLMLESDKTLYIYIYIYIYK